MARIGEILSRTRRYFFTGREKEITEFGKILEGKELSEHVVFIYGPAGQGKTTLLNEFVELCCKNHNEYIQLNCSEIIPTSAGFLEALLKHMSIPGFPEMLDLLEQKRKTFVFFVDNYEKIESLDEWVNVELLPQFPENVLTVFSGRNGPSPRWTDEPAWKNIVRIFPIQNFTSEESMSYLQKRKIPSAQHEKILDFTHGHPLALSLVADTIVQNPKRNFSPDESPDIVQTLLDNFLLKAPSPAHKTALEICAMASITTESLLASAMELEDASGLFEWLRSLSFIDSGNWGLYPHDLARETFVADLKWRNPDWFKHLYRKIKAYYISQLQNATGEEQRKYLIKLNYLHRNHPVVRPFYRWQENKHYKVDFLKKEDIKPLLQIVEKFEGDESSNAFKFWVNHPAARVWVWRTIENPQCGFLMRININELSEKEKLRDEVMSRVLAYANQKFHLRKGEVCTVFRFWMSSENYQKVSELQSSIFLHVIQYYLMTPGLAVHLFHVAEPEFWNDFLSYLNLKPVPELKHVIEKNTHGFYMNDWRITPPVAWIKLLGEGEVSSAPEAELAERKLQITILNETEFYDSIYSALKDYHREKRLEDNPLTRSRFVVTAAGTNLQNGECAVVLREKLDEAIKKIEQSPRYEKAHRILYRTFINPVGSQEQTAEFLSLPFSTYRRQLKKAVTLVSEILWRQETSV